jgi:hypothetical protein
VQNVNAHFNAGYWASQLSEKTQGQEQLRWLQLAQNHYAQALILKPDKHEAAHNLGVALLSEAEAIRDVNQDRSNELLNQALRMLGEHARDAPELVAYILACVYGLGGNVEYCLKWLEVCKAHNKLPNCELLRAERYLDPVRNDPAFIEWFKQVCP